MRITLQFIPRIELQHEMFIWYLTIPYTISPARHRSRIKGTDIINFDCKIVQLFKLN